MCSQFTAVCIHSSDASHSVSPSRWKKSTERTPLNQMRRIDLLIRPSRGISRERSDCDYAPGNRTALLNINLVTLWLFFFRPTHPQWLCRCRKHTQTLAASAPSFFGYSLHQQIFSSGAPFVWPSIWLDAALFYTTNVYLVAPKLIWHAQPFPVAFRWPNTRCHRWIFVDWSFDADSFQLPS